MALSLSINAFHETMVHLSYGTAEADLFSEACVEQYDDRPVDGYGYLFAQVFEPEVLNEIAALEGCSCGALEALDVGSGSRIDALRGDIGGVARTPVQGVNIAAALISISRFKLAETVLGGITRRACDPRDLFEIAMLDFVIGNRRGETDVMRMAFHRMRGAIEAGNIPASRVIDAAAQSVVWHMKSGLIDKTTFDWFSATGKALVDDDSTIDPGARSSWYRAIAMIPAARGDKAATRELMIRARRAGEETLTLRLRAYEKHFLKTYHESALKEHLYLTGDRDAALAEAAALVALDPYWAPSYGEQAEVHRKFDDWSAAAACFEHAGGLGPPYVGHHLFSAAQAWEQADAPEMALGIYFDLLSLDEQNVSVAVAGLRLADKLGHVSQRRFGALVAAAKDRLTSEHREYLHR